MTETETGRLSLASASEGASFDVHRLVAVRVDPNTPGEAQLRDMMAPFLGQSQADLEIRVGAAHGPVTEQSHAEDAYRFTSDSLFIPRDGVQVRKIIDGFRVNGDGELLTAVIPLLDRLCVLQDTAMIHAAVVDYRGAGVLLPAWGGVGKTSTVAKLVALPGVRFMADDWAFLSGDGTLFGYAKPMFIKPHHRTIYPQLFQGARKPLAPRQLTASIARLATAVHPVVVRHPRTAAFTRRWSPEHRMVHPDQVFGSEKIAQSAPTRFAMFLERYEASAPAWERRPLQWMASRMIGNFHSELPIVSRRLVEALGATGLVPLETHFGQKAALVAQALHDVPCSLLRVPLSWSADQASEYIAETVRRQLNE